MIAFTLDSWISETSLPILHCLHKPASREEKKISAPFCTHFTFTPTHISGYSRSDFTSGSNNGGQDGISTSQYCENNSDSRTITSAL